MSLKNKDMRFFFIQVLGDYEMASEKTFPKCAAVNALKDKIKKAGETAKETEIYQCRLLVNFVLWIVNVSAKNHFSMDTEGNVVPKENEISLDQFIRDNIKELVQKYLANISTILSERSYATFLCNFRRVVDFLTENGYATKAPNEKLIPDPEPALRKAKKTSEKVKADRQKLPAHPLIVLYTSSNNQSNVTNCHYRLRLLVMTLMGVDTAGYKEYWTKEHLDAEQKSLSELEKQKKPPESQTILAQILNVNQEKETQLSSIVDKCVSFHPTSEIQIRSEIRVFYAWLKKREWTKASLPIERVEPTHPALQLFLDTLEQNTNFRAVKSRLKFFLSILLEIKLPDLKSFWTDEVLKQERAAIELLKSQKPISASKSEARSLMEELVTPQAQDGTAEKAIDPNVLSNSQLQKIIGITSEELNAMVENVFEGNPSRRKSFRIDVRRFYNWLRSMGWTDAELPYLERTSKKTLESPPVAKPTKTSKKKKSKAASKPKKAKAKIKRVRNEAKAEVKPKKGEARAKRKQEIEAKAEAKRKQDEAKAEAKRLKDEAKAEAKRLKDEAKAEAKRLKDEARAKSKQDTDVKAETKRKQNEAKAEAKRLKDEAETKRKQDETEAEAKRLKDEAETKRKQDEAEAEAKRQKDEADAIAEKERRRRAVVVKTTPTQRAKAYVETNFETRKFKKKIQPLLNDTKIFVELDDFYIFRNHLLLAFWDYGGIPINKLHTVLAESYRSGMTGDLATGEKFVIEEYLRIVKERNLERKYFFVSDMGDSVFKKS
jgi:hypothetical protein